VGGSCSTHGGGQGIYTKFWLENLNGRDNLEELGINGKIIFEWILDK
jgi:hypothetical protein